MLSARTSSPTCNAAKPTAQFTTGPRPKVAFVSNNPFDFWTIAQAGCDKLAAQVRASEVNNQQVVELITSGRSGNLGGVEDTGALPPVDEERTA